MELRGENGGALHSILAQPKRQGLLAYLAVAIPRGYHRRDTLVGLLWPDSDEEHARASLSRAVNHLRQTLGADTLISRGHAELGLDWHRIWCDAAGFEEALDRGDAAEAMALYRGDLLPGFYIEEAPEFEQWVERERARLRARAVQAAKLLSEREEANGQIGQALEWARRASTLDALDESAVRRIMTLLDKGADRAGALRTYDEFAARLRTELDAAPAAETTSVMKAIRDRAAAVAVVAVASPVIAAPVVAAPVVASPVYSPPAPPSAFPPGAPPWGVSLPRLSSPAPAWWQRRGALALAAAGLAVALTGLAIFGRASESPGAGEQIATVAVLPFVVAGDASANDRQLGADMVTLLSEQLDHSGILRAIDSRTMRSVGRPVSAHPRGADSARALVSRFQPGFVLLGEIDARGADDSLRILVALFDSVAREPVARASVAGVAADVARMAAELSNQLLALRPTRREPMWDRKPALLTQSVPALRAFLAGETSYQEGHFADAGRAYKAAVDADTTFALAYLRLSRVASWLGDYTMEDFATQRAIEYQTRLTRLDRLLARGWQAYLQSQPAEAARLSRLILVNDAGHADAWYLLGEVQFHWGPALGWTIPEARASFEHAYFSSNHAGTLVHLARIAASQGRPQAVDSAVRKALSLGVDHPQSLELRALRALAMGDRAEAERLSAEIARLDDVHMHSVVSQVATHAAEYPGVRSVMAALRRNHDLGFRVQGAILSAELAVMRGQLGDAERDLKPGAEVTRARSLELRAEFAALPFRRTAPAVLAALRDSLRRLPAAEISAPQSDQSYWVTQAYLLAMLALRAGDAGEAERIAADMASRIDERAQHSFGRNAFRLIRAELLRARGRPAEALAALGQPREYGGIPTIWDYALAHERFLRGELLRELKRWNEALRWYETFPDPGAYDLPYLAAVHAAKGATFEALGNREAARASYERAVALYANADPELAPVVASARARLAALR